METFPAMYHVRVRRFPLQESDEFCQKAGNFGETRARGAEFDMSIRISMYIKTLELK